MSSTWHAHVRIEKNGKYAEYNDTISVQSLDATEPTDADIKADLLRDVMERIINHSPAMKGGRITHNSVRRIR